MNSAIQSSLKQTISSLENKSKEVGEADFNESISSDRVKAAHARIGASESRVDAQKTNLADIEAQLNPPPTKEVSEGGKNGGTKTVVDQDEVRRLNSEKELINTQLTQAKNEVDTARQEADESSTKALTDAGIKQEAIQELGTLQSRISSMQQSLEKGETVPGDDVKKLAEDIGKFTEQFKKEDNKGDLLGNAIYDPLAKGLKDIQKLLEKGTSSNSSSASTNTNAGAQQSTSASTSQSTNSNSSSSETNRTVTSTSTSTD